MLRQNKYHPIALTQDLVRKDMFDVLIQRDGDDYILLKYCKSFVLQQPGSNVVQVPWIGGIMQLAGRQAQAYSLNASFLVTADENQKSAMDSLYNWRNQAFGHYSGSIGHARDYKSSAEISVYDVTGKALMWKCVAEGLWPSQIQDQTLDVSDDNPIECNVQFVADKIYLANSSRLNNL